MKSSSDILHVLEMDVAFRKQIDAWVLEALSSKQLPMDEFLMRLPGVFPTEAMASLRRLARRGLVNPCYSETLYRAIRRRSRIRKTQRKPSHTHHLEHPLDYEWPFTRAAHQVLLSHVNMTHPDRRATVLCLGCPTFYAYAQRTAGRHSFVLWDKNATRAGQVAEAYAISNIDISCDPIPSILADVAILDPPWYNKFYQLFLWAALRSLRVGGKIIFSFPPIGTRPSAASDLKALLNWCQENGTILQHHLATCLPYRSPLFEVNALRAQGFHQVPLFWRRGDLLILEKRADIQRERPKVTHLSTRWDEYGIGSVRIKVRQDNTHSNGSPLSAVGRTAILPSVSTRFPARDTANVVTSGNRFLYTASPKSVAEICQTFTRHNSRSKQPVLAAHGSPIHSRLRSQLRRLVRQEQSEADFYFTQVYDSA